MPFYPDGKQDEGLPYEIENYWEHVVAHYLKVSMFDVLDLDFDDYLSLRREAFISELSRTEDGKEYLRNAKMFESEDADYEGLSKLQKRGVV